jgi:hypothetical protein
MEIMHPLDLMHNKMQVLKINFDFLILLINFYNVVSLICNARVESHPENTVGLLTMAGKGYLK